MSAVRVSLVAVPAFLLACGAVAFFAGCSDNPVPDAEIDSLGPEQGDPGPDHRPGQPCVICHSDNGPASDDPFAVGGTVFHDPASAIGVSGVQVLFVDSNGSSPKNDIITTKSGNFYVRTSDWSPSFPLFVNIYNPTDGTKRVMQSHIGREPSCASCHRDAFNKPEALYSVGHISLYSAPAPAPTGDAGGGGITDGATE